MSIKKITGAWGIPVVLDRKILGFRLTYKEYMKSMPDGYQGKEVESPQTKLGKWITDKTKAIVKKLFPDYVVETKAQYNARMKANYDSEMVASTVTYAKKIRFYDEDVKKMEMMNDQEQHNFIVELKKAKRYIEED